MRYVKKWELNAEYNMTQDKKDLLLKDLCARLSYGVKGRVLRRDHNNRECEFVKTIDGKLYDRFAVAQESWYDNVTIKPYLFPISSMTDEQDKEFMSIQIGYPSVDWFNKNHIDYRGLIPAGLAIDATGLGIY